MAGSLSHGGRPCESRASSCSSARAPWRDSTRSALSPSSEKTSARCRSAQARCQAGQAAVDCSRRSSQGAAVSAPRRALASAVATCDASHGRRWQSSAREDHRDSSQVARGCDGDVSLGSCVASSLKEAWSPLAHQDGSHCQRGRVLGSGIDVPLTITDSPSSGATARRATSKVTASASKRRSEAKKPVTIWPSRMPSVPATLDGNSVMRSSPKVAVELSKMASTSGRTIVSEPLHGELENMMVSLSDRSTGNVHQPRCRRADVVGRLEDQLDPPWLRQKLRCAREAAPSRR